jgi:hypothetical protein
MRIRYIVVYVGRSIDRPPYRDFNTWAEANAEAERASMVERVEVYKVNWDSFNLDMGYNAEPGGQRGVFGLWKYERGERV